MKTQILPNVARTLATALLLVAAALPAVAADTPAKVVNINTASAEQLAMLPGVGPSVAARIVAHREEHGKFTKAEELMLVRGIGEKTFATLGSYVAISGTTTLTEKVRVPRSKPASDG